MASGNRPDWAGGALDDMGYCPACSRQPLPDSAPPGQTAVRGAAQWGDPSGRGRAGRGAPVGAVRPMTQALDGGLGEVLPLGDWAGARRRAVSAWRSPGPRPGLDHLGHLELVLAEVLPRPDPLRGAGIRLLRCGRSI